jgi:uncharacterized membrane protein YbaN (DUF454 family)
MLGILNVLMGTAGIFLPLLPTTPFLLLAGYLFARSSPRWHQWLLHHRHLGPYIHAFRNRSGLTRAQKIRIGVSFTVLLGISLYFAPITEMKWLLLGMWLFWMALLVRLKSPDSPVEP